MSARRWSIAVLVLVLGAFSRSLHIATHSFWIDEGYSFYFSQAPDLAAVLASDVHPPLYFAALRLWSELAGQGELALRWFSLLPSMLSLALIYQLGREIRRARAPAWDGAALPVLALLMLALADAENFLAQEARHYTWLVLLVLGSMLFLIRWLRRSRRSDYIVWLLASALMLYAHYIAAFALAAQGVYALLWLRGKARVGALAGLISSGLALAPWLLAIGARQLANRDAHQNWALELSGASLHEIGLKYFTAQWALVIALIALGCVALVYRRDGAVERHGDRLTPLLLCWLIVPFGLTLLVNEFLPFLLPHRLTQWTPVIALLVACGLCNIRQPIRALLIGVLVIYGVTQYDFYYRHQPDWRHIAHLSTRYTTPGDLLLTDVASGDYPLRYYLLRDVPGAPALEDGVRYESLQTQRETAPQTYEAWLPALLDGRETVWLMYWSSDESAFNWLHELAFERTAAFVHRHDGGALGETLMHVYRFDRAQPGEPLARFANGMTLRWARFDLADLRLDTLWETARPLERDYVISAKLLDAGGVVVAQHDSQPQLGNRPSSQWRLGDRVFSPHEMAAGAPIPPGPYRAIAQVYTVSDGEFDNVSTEQAADYALVAEVEIDLATRPRRS